MRGNLLTELVRLADIFMKKEILGSAAIPELRLFKMIKSSAPIPAAEGINFCLVLQGTEEIKVGKDKFLCPKGEYYISTQEAFMACSASEASQDKPFLSLRLSIDVTLIREYIARFKVLSKEASAPDSACVFPLDGPLSLNLARMLKQLDEPEDLEFYTPLLIQEFHYLLLKSAAGPLLMKLARTAIPESMARVLSYLKTNFNQSIVLKDLVKMANMSKSSFHFHFKQATGTSPIQYQKRLRLQEARRLLFAETTDVAVVAYKVGYESPSQFSREYARMFGLSPLRDLKAGHY